MPKLLRIQLERKKILTHNSTMNPKDKMIIQQKTQIC